MESGYVDLKQEHAESEENNYGNRLCTSQNTNYSVATNSVGRSAKRKRKSQRNRTRKYDCSIMDNGSQDKLDDELVKVKLEPVDWTVGEAYPATNSDDEMTDEYELPEVPPNTSQMKATDGRLTGHDEEDHDDCWTGDQRKSWKTLRIKFENFDSDVNIKNEPLDLSAGSLRLAPCSKVPIYKPARTRNRRRLYENRAKQRDVCRSDDSLGNGDLPFSSSGFVYNNCDVMCVQDSNDNENARKHENLSVEEMVDGEEAMKVCAIVGDNEEDNEMATLPIHFLTEATESECSAFMEAGGKEWIGKKNSPDEQNHEDPFDLSSKSCPPELNGNHVCTECHKHFKEKFALLLHMRNHMSAKSLPQYVDNLASQVVAVNRAANDKHLRCDMCSPEIPLRYRSFVDLERHQRLVHGPKAGIECPHCPMTFTSENQLGGHLKVHFGQQRRKCQHCSKEFRYAADCREHEMAVHSDKKSIECLFNSSGDAEVPDQLQGEDGRQITFVCEVCSMYFTCGSDLISHHTKMHAGKRTSAQGNSTAGQQGTSGVKQKRQRIKGPRQCPQCNAEFKNGKNLRSHMRVHSKVKPFTCDLCPGAFVRSSDLRRHKKTHSGEKAFKCHLCVSAFADSSKLKIHMRIHTGERPFKCELCPDAFSQASQFARHMRVHNGEKPFQCQFCPSAFTMTSDYRRHLKIHTGERPFICEYCPASFPEAKNLRIHVRTHTGEKPYKCDTCPAAFAQTANLKRHVKMHTGEKPAKCDVCPSAFSDNHKLRVHMRSHSGEKPYTCAKCPAAFATSSALNRHSLMHSGSKPYKCEECPAVFAHLCKLKLHDRCHKFNGPYKCRLCTATFKNAYGLTVHSHLHSD